MTKTAIYGLAGAMAVGAVVIVAVSQRPESPEEQRAKQALEQRQEQAEEQRQAIEERTRRQQEELEAKAKARREELAAQAKAEQERLAASTQERAEALETRAAEQQQRIEQQVVRAEERVEEAQREAAEAARSELSGTVASVNPDDRTLAIREDASGVAAASQFILPTQLKVGEGTAVLHAGQRLSLSDLQVGDQVRLQLEEEAGQRMVRMIVINQRAAPAAAR